MEWLRGQDFAARITLSLKLKNFSDRVKLQELAQSLASLMSPGILARWPLPLKAELPRVVIAGGRAHFDLFHNRVIPPPAKKWAGCSRHSRSETGWRVTSMASMSRSTAVRARVGVAAKLTKE